MRPAGALALLALTLTGCVTTRDYVDRTSREAARSAVQGAAEELPSLTEPLRETMLQTVRETLQAVEETLPEISRRVTEATLDSVRAGLRDTKTQALVDELVARTIARLEREGTGATRQLIRAVEPVIGEAVGRVVSAATLALQRDLEQELAPRARALAQAGADVLVSTLAAGLDVQLEHLRQTARDIGRELISEAAISMRDHKELVGEVSRVAMQQAVLGAREAVWESLPERVPRGVLLTMAALAALLVACGGVLTVYWWRYRQSARSLTIIARQINDVDDIELKRAIQTRAQESRIEPWLSRFLRARGL